VLGTIATYENLKENDKKADATDGLVLEGFDLKLQALDIRTRAIYLQAKALVDEEKYAEAAAVIDPVAAGIRKQGRTLNPAIQQWSGGQGDAGDDEATMKKKAAIAATAASVDKFRRDTVMVGFKLAAIQGKKDEASRMLELLKTAGGGIAENQGTLELMARELAAQIPALRKAGKDSEAKVLGEGVAILLKEFTSLKELTPTTILFLGQTFQIVGQNKEALAELEKIKPPTPPASVKVAAGTEWFEINPQTIADGQERRKFQEEIRDYRIAQLYKAKALRGLGRHDEGEKLLVDAIGDSEKQGFAFTSLDYRKELGHTYEAKGAAESDPRKANTEWAKALKQWSTLFQIARNRVNDIKPKTETDPGTPELQAKKIKNDFFDAYFEPQRVVVAANAQLIKDPAKLQASLTRVARSLIDLETVNKFNDPVEVETPGGKVKSTVGAELMAPEVAARYRELLKDNPILMNAYAKEGGKFFLARPMGQ
jgi:tetratricopeptide (TPR) repeat protein